jgi:hypothetical protein
VNRKEMRMNINKRKPAILYWPAHFGDKRDRKTYLSSNDIHEPTPSTPLGVVSLKIAC